MGLFSLTQELAIDLGTANTLIIHNGKVVVAGKLAQGQELGGDSRAAVERLAQRNTGRLVVLRDGFNVQ